MLMSGLFGEDLFDDFCGFPTRELANIDKQLYGKHAQNLMKTDVHENEEDYEMDISHTQRQTLLPPGFYRWSLRRRVVQSAGKKFLQYIALLHAQPPFHGAHPSGVGSGAAVQS